MYHACLAQVFEPLKAGMTTPELILCPDGHWRQAIYSLGPYIADYPEQVWLAGIVQGWCPKYVAYMIMCHLTNTLLHRCDAKPDNLPAPDAHRRTRRKTEFIIECFDPGILWKDFGLRSDVKVSTVVSFGEAITHVSTFQPFTYDFPRADIHELLSPDLLHQVIKGIFKDHIVGWDNECLYTERQERRKSLMKLIGGRLLLLIYHKSLF